MAGSGMLDIAGILARCEANVVSFSNDEMSTVLARISELEKGAEGLEKALESIANNSCCDGCQEAGKWARAALLEYRKAKEQE